MAVTKEELNIKVSVDFKDGKKVVTDISAKFKEVENALKGAGKASDNFSGKQKENLKAILKQNEKLQLQIKNINASEVERIQNTLALTKKEIQAKIALAEAGSEVAIALKERLTLEEKLADIRIAEQIEKTNRELAKQSDALIKSESSAKQAKSGFSDAGASIITLNQALELSRKAFRALSASIDFTIANFSRFEQGLIGVAKTANLSEQDAANFGKEITGLAQKIPATTAELFDIAKAAGQLGIEKEELANFTETIVRLGSASDVAGEEAALASARILGLTKTPNSEIDEFASALVNLGNNLRANEAEILRTSTVIGQGIGTFGASADAVIALGGASRDLGIRFELAGSAITRSFVEINQSIAEGGEGLQRLSKITGIAAKDLEKQFGEDSVGVFRKFLEGLSGIEQTKVPIILKSIGLEGVEINRVLPTLAKNLDRVDLAFNLAGKEMENATALTQESERSFGTLDSKIQIMKNAFNNLGVQIGQVFQPIIRAIVSRVTEFFQIMGNSASSLSPMKDTIDLIADAINNLDLKDISQRFMNFAKVVGSLVAAFNVASIAKFSAGLGLLATAAALVTAKFTSVVLLVDLVAQNLNRLDVLFETVSKGMLSNAARIGSAVADLFSGVSDGAKKVSDDLLAFAAKTDQEVNQSLNQLDTKSLDLVLETIAELSTETVDASENVAKLNDEFNKLGKGEGVEKVSDQVKKLNLDLKDFGFGGADDKSLEKQARTLAKINADNLKIQGEINAIGAGKVEQIQAEMQMQKSLLSVKEQELKRQGLLTEEIQAAIDKQRELIGMRGQKQAKQEIFEEQDSQALINTDQLETITGQFGGMIGGFAGAVSSFGTPVTAFLGAADIILSAVQKLIDIVPSLFEKVAKIFDSLVDLPNKLFDSFGKIINSLGGFIEKFIPNLLKSIPKSLTQLFITLPDMIVSSIKNLMASLPDIINEMISALVDSAPDMVANMVSNAAEIGIAITEGMTKNSHKIAIGIIKALHIDLPIAIVEGIIRGIQDIGKALKNAFVGLISDSFKDEMEEFKKNIENVSGQLFQVSTLTTEARASDQADKLRDAVTSAGQKAFDFIKKAWDKIRDWFQNEFGGLIGSAWHGVLNFFSGLGGIISDAWKSIIRFFQSIPELLTRAWHGIIDFFSNFGLRISQAWKGVMEFFGNLGGVVSRAWQGVMDFFGSLGTAVSNAFSGIFESFKKLFSGLGDFIDFGALGEKFKAMFNNLNPGSLLNKLFPGSIPESKGRVESAIGIDVPVIKFNQGGMVPGSAFVPGDSEKNDRVLSLLSPGEFVLSRTQVKALQEVLGGIPQFGMGGFLGKVVDKISPEVNKLSEFFGKAVDISEADLFKKVLQGVEKLVFQGFNKGGMVDSVPSMLTPGEFVVSRPGVQAVGTDFLNQINSGRMPQSNAGVSISNLNIKIETTNKVDEDFIRTRMMPTLKREFKRASLDGEFLLSQRGIR